MKGECLKSVNKTFLGSMVCRCVLLFTYFNTLKLRLTNKRELQTKMNTWLQYRSRLEQVYWAKSLIIKIQIFYFVYTLCIVQVDKFGPSTAKTLFQLVIGNVRINVVIPQCIATSPYHIFWLCLHC